MPPLPTALLLALASRPPVARLAVAGDPPPDGGTHALLAALASMWPTLTPWLVIGVATVALGIATEVVVRELHRLPDASRAGAGPDAVGRSVAPAVSRPAPETPPFRS